MSIVLDSVAAGLAAAHFAAPLAYYLAARRWLARGLGVARDEGYVPRVAVIVPVFNEEEVIVGKLEDIYSQDYPRDKLRVVVVDSASTDSTLRLVEEWGAGHPDEDLVVVEEGERRGKISALNTALRSLRGDEELVAITDADSYWGDRSTLRRAVAYMADEGVAAVSCLKRPARLGPGGVEEGYRGYYNVLRLAESMKWSTPVFHGELAVFRRSLLEELGGFPESIGADDSHTATLLAARGYRSIIPGDVWCVELVPRGRRYLSWKARRAQHLVQHFARSLRELPRAPRGFRAVLAAEQYLHLVNPLLLAASITLLAVSAASGSLLAAALLAAGAAAAVVPEYRTWITSQLLLLYGMALNVRGRNLVWSKEVKGEG